MRYGIIITERKVGSTLRFHIHALALFVVVCGLAGTSAADDKYVAQRHRMVTQQIDARTVTDGREGVKNVRVLEAMRAVPRHEFVPERWRRSAYNDFPLPIGYDQTISQPYIVALMTELLEPSPEHVALEVGTGSGYQAAILAELVEQVYTVEIIKKLGKAAADRLERLKYTNIETRVGDGYHGWEEHAPFDLIVVTAAATHVPPPLIRQLKPGGRMIIPVGSPFHTQNLMLIQKLPDGSVKSRSVIPVRFVPLTGKH